MIQEQENEGLKLKKEQIEKTKKNAKIYVQIDKITKEIEQLNIQAEQDIKKIKESVTKKTKSKEEKIFELMKNIIN